MHADERAPTDTPAQEAKQTEQKAANATVVGQKPVSNETTRNEGSTGNDRKTTRVNPRPGENQSEEDEKKGRP
jgi:hypothetical protein